MDGTLISASCTTGWFDWVHGELWLCSDGLLQRSLGLEESKRHGKEIRKQRKLTTLDRASRPTKAFTAAEIVAIVASDRRNRWIAWDDIAQATLKRGIVDHSLHFRLRSGGRAKFLWLKADGGYDLLEESLGRFLPDRFKTIARRIG